MTRRTHRSTAVATFVVLFLAASILDPNRPAVAGDIGELPRGGDNGGRTTHAGSVEFRINGVGGTAREIVADHEVVVPKGIEASLRFVVPPALEDRVTVDWVGVSESSGRNATLRVSGAGVYRVDLIIHQATRRGKNAGIVQQRSFTIRALDVAPEDVKVRITYPSGAATPPVDLNGDFHVDGRDLDLFWGSYGESRDGNGYRSLSDWNGNGNVDLEDLARFVGAFGDVKGRDVGATYGNGTVMPVTARPRDDENAFATPAPLVAAVTEPAGLESWIDWSVDGSHRGSGAVFNEAMKVPGKKRIEAGIFSLPGMDAAEITLYSAAIWNRDTGRELRSGFDFLVDGPEYHLEARTNPPGFEDTVNWYASTKYGSVTPSRGRGATFTVRYKDTIGGPDAFQWLGVQADNAYLDQDMKAFEDMVWQNEVVTIDNGPSIQYSATLNGTIMVAEDGSPDGSVTVLFDDGSSAVVTQDTDGRMWIATGSIILDMLTPDADVDSALVCPNVILMTEENCCVACPPISLGAMEDSLQADCANDVSPMNMCDENRALLALGMVGKTNQWIHNCQAAMVLESSSPAIALRGKWCKAAVNAATVLLAATAVAVCIACYAGLTITIGPFALSCYSVCTGGAIAVIVARAIFMGLWRP